MSDFDTKHDDGDSPGVAAKKARLRAASKKLRTPVKMGPMKQDVDTVGLKKRLDSNLKRSRDFSSADLSYTPVRTDDEFAVEDANRAQGIARSDSLADARSGKIRAMFGDLAQRRKQKSSGK